MLRASSFITKISRFAFRAASPVGTAARSRLGLHVILVVVHLKGLRFGRWRNHGQLRWVSWRRVFEEVRVMESLSRCASKLDERESYEDTAFARRTSLALSRLRGSNVRHLLSRSSAAGEAAEKSRFNGCFGKNPTEQ